LADSPVAGVAPPAIATDGSIAANAIAATLANTAPRPTNMLFRTDIFMSSLVSAPPKGAVMKTTKSSMLGSRI
jgi:hypothetical protein